MKETERLSERKNEKGGGNGRQGKGISRVTWPVAV